ncbi:lactadherin-like [Dendronephthya gigantea]|uniref:lactadherin-like n=1 Tax=Dendronephthya gigantea TaxID=151771 RepID=UPI00106AD7F3|nr:lactadherin-like [Dendronephthya gigantea]
MPCHAGVDRAVRTEALGMEDRSILDSQITASSIWNSGYRVANGRLNFKQPSGKFESWSALSNDLNEWLQDNFQRVTLITKIGTQGRNDANQFVKSYTISFSREGKCFSNYTQGDAIKPGNNDHNTTVHQTVIPHISARFIRLHPTAWENHISMRVEFYGCSV